MKVGFISDVHANKHALEAVLNELGDVDLLICCGDVIGYGPSPSECVELVREHADITVRGNHDRTLTQGDINSYQQNNTAYEGLRYAKQNLSEEQKDWLNNLNPVDSTGPVRVSHSHPANEDEYVFKRNFPAMGKFAEDEEEVLSLGHTHDQSALDLDQFHHDCLVLNPGSVGHPRNGDPRAEYAVVTLTEDSREVDLRAVEYDYEAAANLVESVGLPDETAERYRKGTTSRSGRL